MPLKGRPSPPAQSAITTKAAETFERLNKSFDKLEKTTEVLAVRLPRGERERLRLLFAHQGLTISQGVKAALYAYTKGLS